VLDGFFVTWSRYYLDILAELTKTCVLVEDRTQHPQQSSQELYHYISQFCNKAYLLAWIRQYGFEGACLWHGEFVEDSHIGP
jgi:hypothetical protein